MSSNFEDLYQQIILDHYKCKNGCGKLLTEYDGKSHQTNPLCGDEVTLTLNLNEQQQIVNLKWSGDGCSISQASLSMMHQLVIHQNLNVAMGLIKDFQTMLDPTNTNISDELLDRLADASALQGVAHIPARIKCALLGWMALKEALVQAQSKQNHLHTKSTSVTA